MEKFFQKYAKDLTEANAIKLISKKINCAKKAVKDSDASNYIKQLSEANVMITDFLAEKSA